MNVRITWNGERIERDVDDAIMRGLTASAEVLLQQSRAIVPLEEGTLERSGAASTDASRMAAAVSYDTVYAARQHEETTWRHASGRSAKYLEGPWLANKDTYARLLQAEIRKAIK